MSVCAECGLNFKTLYKLEGREVCRRCYRIESGESVDASKFGRPTVKEKIEIESSDPRCINCGIVLRMKRRGTLYCGSSCNVSYNKKIEAYGSEDAIIRNRCDFCNTTFAVNIKASSHKTKNCCPTCRKNYKELKKKARS